MIAEDLRDWFGKGPEGSASGGGWDRYSTTGKKLGKCGDRKPGEGKPKCLSKKAAARLRAKGGAKEVGKAVRRKKRKDPNPERKGEPKHVNTESLLNQYVIFIEHLLQEKNEPTNKKLWASAKAAASRKYKIKNSAYKSGYAVQWYNKRGGGWRTVSENIQDKVEVKMFRSPATIAIIFPSGLRHLYTVPEHHLDSYYEIFRRKLGSNPEKLEELLKSKKIPVDKVNIRESRVSRGHLLNEIAGSFDADFPNAKALPLRKKMPENVPQMHADERDDVAKDKKDRKDSDDSEGEANYAPKEILIYSGSDEIYDASDNQIIQKLSMSSNDYEYVEEIAEELKEIFGHAYKLIRHTDGSLYFVKNSKMSRF